MTKYNLIRELNNNSYSNTSVNPWDEATYKEHLNVNKSYFIKDTIKKLSKHGQDFQGRSDVYNLLVDVVHSLDLTVSI